LHDDDDDDDDNDNNDDGDGDVDDDDSHLFTDTLLALYMGLCQVSMSVDVG
jgi:hypothetical protein